MSDPKVKGVAEGCLPDATVAEQVRELNIMYLMLARQLARTSTVKAMFRLGVSKGIAERVGKLTPAQILTLASASERPFEFRFDDSAVLAALTGNSAASDLKSMHAAILLARQSVLSLE